MKSLINHTVLSLTLGCCFTGFAQQQTTDSLQRVIRGTRTDTVKVNAYNKLAARWAASNVDSTIAYTDLADALSHQINYPLGLAAAQINRGNISIITGKLETALKHFAQAQQQYEQLLDADPENTVLQNGLARSYGSAGIVYSQQSNYYLALEQYQKALKRYQQSGDKVSVSKALNNIGIVYKAQQNPQKALEYFQKALQLQQEIGESNQAVTLTNIGVIHFDAKQYGRALTYYQQAEKRFTEDDNQYGLALVHNHLGDYYKSQKDLPKAQQCYQQSLEGYEAMQNKFGASLALYNLARLQFVQNNLTAALPLAVKSLEYAQSVGVLDQTFHSEKLLSELYGKLGKPALAFEHYKNYIAARDSISNQEHNKKFAMAEMNFEYKQKEALLEEKGKRQTQFLLFALLAAVLLGGLIFALYNRRQVKRRLTLQKEVAEYEQKALHLQMNPHFVFNCLGAISSFIVQNGTDSALKYLSKFSKLMRLTLEYSKGSLIPIDKEIESLRNYLELEQLRFNHKFDFTIKSSPQVEFNMGLPPLLIQPFVENAILHGVVPKEGRGSITVDFDVRGGQLWCTVSDDGIGLTESHNMKEHSVLAHKSMALEITKKRLEIMESTTSKSAQIDISEKENHSGTKVTLRLPVQYIQ